MNDRSQSDLSPTVEHALVAGAPTPTDTTWNMVSEQLDQVLPRLTALGTRVAVLAPALVGIIGIDSFGRGIQC
jgi:hypothetical protein